MGFLAVGMNPSASTRRSKAAAPVAKHQVVLKTEQGDRKALKDMTTEEIDALKLVPLSAEISMEYEEHFTYCAVDLDILYKCSNDPEEWEDRLAAVRYFGESKYPAERCGHHRTHKFKDMNFGYLIVRVHTPSTLSAHQKESGSCTTLEELGHLDEYSGSRLWARWKSEIGYCSLIQEFRPGRGFNDEHIRTMATNKRVHEFMMELDDVLCQRDFVQPTSYRIRKKDATPKAKCPVAGCDGGPFNGLAALKEHLMGPRLHRWTSEKVDEYFKKNDIKPPRHRKEPKAPAKAKKPKKRESWMDTDESDSFEDDDDDENFNEDDDDEDVAEVILKKKRMIVLNEEEDPKTDVDEQGFEEEEEEEKKPAPKKKAAAKPVLKVKSENGTEKPKKTTKAPAASKPSTSKTATKRPAAPAKAKNPKKRKMDS